MHAMTHSEIIDALGGTKAIADSTGSKENAVSNWRERGIPWRKRGEIARLAKDAKVMLPADFLVPLA